MNMLNCGSGMALLDQDLSFLSGMRSGMSNDGNGFLAAGTFSNAILGV